MEGGPPMFSQDSTCPALLEDNKQQHSYGAVTHYGRPSQAVLISCKLPLA